MNEPAARLARGWLGAIFGVALVLRVLCVAQYQAQHPLADRPVIDEASYDGWARRIAGGELVGEGIFFQEPLYPYALGAVYAVAGDEPARQREVARYAQAVLGALSSVLIALLAARLFSAGAGIVAGLAFALHRPAVWFPTLLLKENLFLPLFVGLALMLVRARDPGGERRRALLAWLAIGVVAALAALLRGNLLVLLPCIVLWPVVRALVARRRVVASLAAGAAVVVGVALVLAPVALRNHAVGGRFVLTTSGAGTNFYGGNNLDNPYGAATEFAWVRGTPEHEADDWRHEASRRAGRELDPTETSDFWLDAALDSMRAQPREHLAILWNKLRLTLGRYEVPDNHFLEWDARFVPLLRWPLPGFELTGLLAVAGLLLFVLDLAGKRLERASAAGEVLVLALLYLATIVLTVTSERVRLPLLAVLLPFAGYIVTELPGLLHEPRRWLPVSLAVAAAAPLVLVHVLPESKRGTDFDERDYNLAVRLINADELARAEPLVRGLERAHGNAAATLLLAAELEWRQARAALGELPEAGRLPREQAEQIERALVRLENVARRGDAKSRYRAQFLAGTIREWLGQWGPAETDYRAASAFDAEDRELRRRLARVIAEQAMQLAPGDQRSARLREAIEVLERLLEGERDAQVERLLERVRAQL